ncbi:MAG: UDP-N-acetylglucosamine 1-carboxyvinyltransferase [Azospirillum brasilense]|nr:MAG: UDP-N-acetylglucosamine 1-carboxyvinyltransferase [Azospirillum brasilense]
MDRLRIVGGKPLHGKIVIGGAKNAALPLLCAALLTHEKVTLDNVPYLADVTTMAKLLVQHGASLSLRDTSPGTLFGREFPGHYSREISLHTPEIINTTAPYDLVRTMRASILVLGPLLARAGYAKISLPGGCAIGARPVDMHLAAMEALGATITLEEGYVIAQAPKDGLVGAEITFDKVSVGATENAVMAATLARGTTTIHNAAREPEIGDLCHMLNSMGADISGIDSSTLTIRGVTALSGTSYRVIADRIETGTYLCAVALAGGELELLDARADTLETTIDALRAIGLHIEVREDSIYARHEGGVLKPQHLVTEPHPAFPTDMQAQLMTVLTHALGTSSICETIFENRFMHVPELARMGANISIDGNCATIHGGTHFKGAPVMATDLRASVSLVIAALAAEGETIISRIYHLDRGYERLEEKLANCGAHIQRLR